MKDSDKIISFDSFIKITDSLSDPVKKKNGPKSKPERALDWAKYYLSYYKNLSPTGFKVTRKDNLIIIEVPEAKKK